MTQSMRAQRTIKKVRLHMKSTLRSGSFAGSSSREWSAAQLPCGCSRTRPAARRARQPRASVQHTHSGGKGLPGMSRASPATGVRPELIAWLVALVFLSIWGLEVGRTGVTQGSPGGG